jgi:capsular exopolysaccharide synthesis family protein
MSTPAHNSAPPALNPAVADSSLVPVGTGGSAAEQTSMREAQASLYWSYLLQYRWYIATFVLLATVASALYALSLPKQYQATTLIRISQAGTQVVGGNNDLRQSANVSNDALIATAQQVIQAPAVVLQTMDQLHLDDNPAILAAKSRQNLSVQQVRDTVLHSITDHITVEHPPMTLLVAVRYTAPEPDLAAQVANGLAASFLQLQFQTRLDALRASSNYMSQQLDDMRAEMERSQKALVDYETKNNVADPDDKNNIYQSQLAQTDQDLGKAQSERVRLQAVYDAVQAGGMDALLATERGQVLLPLEQQVREAQAKQQNMALIYGPEHPLLRQQQREVANAQQRLQQAGDHVRQQLASEYAAASQREALLTRKLESEKLALDAFNLRAVQFSALKGEATSSTNLYYDLLQRIKEANVSAEFHSDNVSIVDKARPNPIPVAPRVKLIILLGFLISGLVGCAAAVLVGSMDRSIGSTEQLEQWLRLPVVGTLPASASAGTSLAPTDFSPLRARVGEGDGGAVPEPTAFREAILSLRSNLLFSQEAGCGLLAISSAVPHEGKSTVSANLAAALAGLRGQTLLIDGDLRRPTVHRLFGLPNRAGLTTVLRGRSGWESLVLPVASVPGLSVLPAGPSTSGPGELLLHGLAGLLDAVRERYEYVVVDCPPVIGFADAAVICHLAEGTLLIANAGETDRDALRAATVQLRRAQANLLGIVLNRVTQENSPYYYHYNYEQYYRAYSHGEDEESEGSSDD